MSECALCYLGTVPRNHFPTHVSKEEWEFEAPNLTLMCEDDLQQNYPTRERIIAFRLIVRAGAP